MNAASGNSVARLTLDDLSEGQQFALGVRLTRGMVDGFADLTGDHSPLHMDDAFARDRGFAGRVAHGVLLGGFVSRVVGMHFPGENALLQSITHKFAAPAYIDDPVQVILTVDQVSPGTQTAVLKLRIHNADTDALLVRGKVQVGFTRT